MNARKIKTIPVPKNEWVMYWARAKELYESMDDNMKEGRWNAAVIDGVHCAISANDAFTVATLGHRCGSDDHADAVDLFVQAMDHQEGEGQLGRFRRLLSIKSHVEYGPSLVHEAEAKKVFTDVERFYRWIASRIGTSQ